MNTPNLKTINLKTIKLSPSQKRSLGAYALILLTAANSEMQKLQAAHIPLPWWVSTLVIPAAGGGFMLLSRSLDRSNSGNGGGIVGAPQAEASEPVATTLGPLTGLPPLTLAGPSPQDFALAVQPLIAAAMREAASQKSPVLSDVLTLLMTNASALSEPRQLTLLATAGTHLTEQSGEASQTLMGAKQMDSAALLAGIAEKADAIKTDTTLPAEEPKEEKQPNVVAQFASNLLGKSDDKSVPPVAENQAAVVSDDVLPDAIPRPAGEAAPTPSLTAASQE